MSTQTSLRHPLAVLVVDDSADTAESLAELLTLRGHAVEVALDGTAALERVAARPPDVVLLDIRMPGLDGCAVARLIRLQCAGKRPFLVAITGCGSDADRIRCGEAGFDLHLVKPVDPPLLLGVLEGFRQLFTPSIPAAELVPSDAPTDLWPTPRFAWRGERIAIPS
jgi:two-component system, OmpR family, response regulator